MEKGMGMGIGMVSFLTENLEKVYQGNSLSYFSVPFNSLFDRRPQVRHRQLNNPFPIDRFFRYVTAETLGIGHHLTHDAKSSHYDVRNACLISGRAAILRSLIYKKRGSPSETPTARLQIMYTHRCFIRCRRPSVITSAQSTIDDTMTSNPKNAEMRFAKSCSIINGTSKPCSAKKGKSCEQGRAVPSTHKVK